MSKNGFDTRNFWLRIRRFIPESILQKAVAKMEQSHFEKIRENYRKRSLFPAPTPEAFLDWLDTQQDLSEKEVSLKELARLIRLSEDIDFYDQLLSRLIPDYLSDYLSANFMGKGQGSGGLNLYRKLTLPEAVYFEKPYFGSSKELKTILWFDQHIAPIFNSQIHTARVRNQLQGETISLVYFDFLDLEKDSQSSFEKKIFGFTKKLYSLTELHADYLKGLDIPIELTDFNLHYQYRHNKKTLERLSLEHGIDYLPFEQAAHQSKKVLTHGDLHEENIFAKQTLIDWDHFGMYPIGFDVAFSFFRILENDGYDKNQRIIEWLRKHFTTTVPEEDWKDFVRNFFYFLYVFSIKRIEKSQLQPTEAILNQLKVRLQSYF